MNILEQRKSPPVQERLVIYEQYIDASNWKTKTEGVGIFAPQNLNVPLTNPQQEIPS